MGFWNDYFKYGIGEKAKNLVGGIILRNKFNDLLSKYKQSPQVDPYGGDTQPTTESTLPVPYKAESDNSQPKQDLQGNAGDQTVQQDTQPSAGGEGINFGNLQPQTLPTDNTLIRKYQAPTSDNTQVPILSNKDKGKIDHSALQQLFDPESRRKYNEQLQNDVLGFLSDASRVSPEQYGQYSKLVESLLGVKSLQEPTQPKFDEKMFSTDKNGMLMQYKYNPYSRTYVQIPVTDASGKNIQTKLPETQDITKLQWSKDANGNGIYFDPETQTWKDSGQKYDALFPKVNLEQQELDLKKEGGYYTKYPPKYMVNSGGGNGTGSTGTIQSGGKTLYYNGQPMTQDNMLEVGLIDSNAKLMFKYLSGNAKQKKQAIDYFAQWHPEMTWETSTPENKPKAYYTPDNITPEEKDWRNLFHSQYVNWKGNDPTKSEQARQWLLNPENQAYAKKLGLIK